MKIRSVRDAAALVHQMSDRAAARDNGRRPGDWYRMRNLAPGAAEVMIYDEIGFFGVTASDFVRDLAEVNASTIELRINSPGGDVFDGVAIYNALRRHPAAITAHVDGLAASAASFIAMAGDRILVGEGAQMMIHEASGLCIGPAEDMLAMAELLDKTSESIAGIYAARTGIPAGDWRAAMHAETWYTAEEAVRAGLADATEDAEVADPSAPLSPAALAARFDTSRFRYANRAAAPAPDVPQAAVPQDDPPPTVIDYGAALRAIRLAREGATE